MRRKEGVNLELRNSGIGKWKNLGGWIVMSGVALRGLGKITEFGGMSEPPREYRCCGWRTVLGTALVVGVIGFLGGRWSAKSDGRWAVVLSEIKAKQDAGVALVEARGDVALKAMNNQSGWKTYASELEQLAKTQPEQALQRALAERNLSLRAQLRLAVLRGWAATNPEAAAEWAIGRSVTEREGCFEALMAGASAQSAAAEKIALMFSARESDRAPEYTLALVDALGEVGSFRDAVKFVSELPATTQPLQAMNRAFSLWAAHDPERAAKAIDSIAEASMREEAFRGFVIGWAEADPAALAKYAVELPAGDRRVLSFANALPRWLDADPEAAAVWVRDRGTDPHPDFDPVVLAVSTNAAVTAWRPDIAASLAESISDPSLRSNTLRTLAFKWNETDPAAARRYVEGSRFLTPEEKMTLSTELVTLTK